MAVTPNPRKGDIGTPITLTATSNGVTPIDISSATVKQITLQDPNGVESTYTASFVTTGADGEFRYTTVATTDLGVVGSWIAQGYIEMSPGKWHTSFLRFRVDPNLSDI